MTSRIYLKATSEEIVTLFEMPNIVNICCYERHSDTTYKVIIRHCELDKPLSGTFTITSLVKRLTEKNAIPDENINLAIDDYFTDVKTKLTLLTKIMAPKTGFKSTKNNTEKIDALCNEFQTRFTELISSEMNSN